MTDNGLQQVEALLDGDAAAFVVEVAVAVDKTADDVHSRPRAVAQRRLRRPALGAGGARPVRAAAGRGRSVRPTR